MTPRMVRVAGGVFLGVSVIGPMACGGGDAAPTEPPNPLGVADTIVLAIQTNEVELGDTLRLTVVALDVSGATVPNVVLTWRSLDPTIASVSPDGLVTALTMGEATIEVEATIPGSSMALAIDSTIIGTTSLRRVKSRFKMLSVPKIWITPTSATVVEKDHQLFTANVTLPSNVTSAPIVKWSSSNSAVASIDVAGLATGITKGTTIITATVTVGSASGIKRTATLTVSDALCGGIATVQTLNATVSYDYVIGGTVQPYGRVASEYHGSLTATLTNLGWEPGIPTVVFTGPVKGTASQVESVFDEKNKETRRLEGGGAPVNNTSAGAESVMHVIIELKDCTYKADADIAINLTSYADGNKGPTLPMPSVSLYIGAGKTMNTTGGNPFPIVTDQDFPGHALIWAYDNPKQDAFVPKGWAEKLLQGNTNALIGNAQVDYVIAK